MVFLRRHQLQTQPMLQYCRTETHKVHLEAMETSDFTGNYGKKPLFDNGRKLTEYHILSTLPVCVASKNLPVCPRPSRFGTFGLF